MGRQFDILQAGGHAIATDAALANVPELVADMILGGAPSKAATIFLKTDAAGELRFAVARGQAAANLRARRIWAGMGVMGNTSLPAAPSPRRERL